MSIENNRYGGTAADLNLRKQEKNQPTDEMIEMITKAGKWARYVSYSALLGMIFMAIAVLPLIIFGLRAPGFLVAILPMAGLLYVAWLIYNLTKEYANLARDLDSTEDATEDLASCFELHTRFIKLISVFTILMFVIVFVIGLVAGIKGL